MLLGSEPPNCCAALPGPIFKFEARRFPELKISPGSLKLYDCRESDFRVETHWTNGLMPLKVAQKIAVVSSALLHTATRTLSSGEAVLVVWVLNLKVCGCFLTCHIRGLCNSDYAI